MDGRAKANWITCDYKLFEIEKFADISDDMLSEVRADLTGLIKARKMGTPVFLLQEFGEWCSLVAYAEDTALLNPEVKKSESLIFHKLLISCAYHSILKAELNSEDFEKIFFGVPHALVINSQGKVIWSK